MIYCYQNKSEDVIHTLHLYSGMYPMKEKLSVIKASITQQSPA